MFRYINKKRNTNCKLKLKAKERERKKIQNEWKNIESQGQQELIMKLKMWIAINHTLAIRY